jgi:hypothetical protein
VKHAGSIQPLAFCSTTQLLVAYLWVLHALAVAPAVVAAAWVAAVAAVPRLPLGVLQTSRGSCRAQHDVLIIQLLMRHAYY